MADDEIDATWIRGERGDLEETALERKPERGPVAEETKNLRVEPPDDRRPLRDRLREDSSTDGSWSETEYERPSRSRSELAADLGANVGIARAATEPPARSETLPFQGPERVPEPLSPPETPPKPDTLFLRLALGLGLLGVALAIGAALLLIGA